MALLLAVAVAVLLLLGLMLLQMSVVMAATVPHRLSLALPLHMLAVAAVAFGILAIHADKAVLAVAVVADLVAVGHLLTPELQIPAAVAAVAAEIPKQAPAVPVLSLSGTN